MLENMKQMNFRFDAKTIDLIDELKDNFDLRSNAAVIRRALALLKIAGNAQRDDAELLIRKNEGGVLTEKIIVMT